MDGSGTGHVHRTSPRPVPHPVLSVVPGTVTGPLGKYRTGHRTRPKPVPDMEPEPNLYWVRIPVYSAYWYRTGSGS